MSPLRMRLRGLWWNIHARWLGLTGRGQIWPPAGVLLESRPWVKVFNLVLLNAARSVSDNVPCDVTISQSNILDYAGEWENAADGPLSEARRDAHEAWRLMTQRMDELERAGGDNKGLARGEGQVGVLDIRVSRPAKDRICLNIRRADPADAEEFVEATWPPRRTRH